MTAEDVVALQAQRRLQFDEEEGEGGNRSRLALQSAEEGA